MLAQVLRAAIVHVVAVCALRRVEPGAKGCNRGGCNSTDVHKTHFQFKASSAEAQDKMNSAQNSTVEHEMHSQLKTIIANAYFSAEAQNEVDKGVGSSMLPPIEDLLFF